MGSKTVDKPFLYARETHASTLSRGLAAGTLQRIAKGVYSKDTVSSPEELVRRGWSDIVGHEFPNAVISDRSAPTGGAVEGVLYLVHAGRARTLQLPGLLVRARPGAGPLDGDGPLFGGLYMASVGRGLAENVQLSRARSGEAPRAMRDGELADWVDRICQLDGERRLAAYRVQAEEVAAAVGTKPDRLAYLNRLVGAALGSQPIPSSGSAALQARSSGFPFDPDRMQLFDRLVQALRASAPQSLRVYAAGRQQFLPFFEAYFSNFIEGTEFVVEDAIDIVFRERVIPNRAQDSHDLIGTYRLVTDEHTRADRADTPREFLDLLRSRHAVLLGGRPEMRPGEFKTMNNRAGGTQFVDHGLVAGTLMEGWRRLADLDTPFERSVFTMFLVAETHPFDDGNGRTARVFANAELSAGKECRIVIPTVYRTDYLDGLRRMSRQGEGELLIKVMRFAQQYSNAINFTELRSAIAELEQTHAFNEPESAERLRMPAVRDR